MPLEMTEYLANTRAPLRDGVTWSLGDARV